MKQRLCILFLSLLAAALLGGCADQPEPAETVTLGSRLVVDKSGVVFWTSGPYLCSGLLDEEGHVYDAVIESQSKSDLLGVAAYDHYLYMAGEEGLFRYPMEDMSAGGMVVPEPVTEDEIDDGFAIFRDMVYYRYGTTVYQIPVTGGERTVVARDADHFTVTADGVCFSAADGGLYLVSHDGVTQQRLTETDEDCTFALAGDDILYRCEENDQIFCYSLTDGSTEVVNKRSPLSGYSDLWATEEALLFESDEYEVRLFSFETQEETLVTEEICFPHLEEGFLFGHVLYSYDDYDDILYEFDLSTGAFSANHFREKLEALIAGNSAQAVPNEESAPQTDAVTGASNPGLPNGFDILTDLQVMDGGYNVTLAMGRYFLLAIPADLPWYLEPNDPGSFTIYHIGALEQGYGGQVVTIKAYPCGNTSYQSAPSWALAGEADGIQYVAFFPTDVQFNTGDETQACEYRALLDHFQTIGTEETPFVCGGQGGP